MAEEDAAKKKAEDQQAPKASEAAKKKADDDAKARNAAEDKRQEELTNHMIHPIYMLTQAGVQFVKAKPELGSVGKVIYISALYYESVEVLSVEI